MSRARHCPPETAPATGASTPPSTGPASAWAAEHTPQADSWTDDSHDGPESGNSPATDGQDPQAEPRPGTGTGPDMRLDKWLWAARFYKTRSLAADEIGKGRVRVNGQPAKPARSLRAGDQVQLRQGPVERTVNVLALSAVRGPAPVAQALYAETADSTQRRQQAAENRRLAAEPALAITQGRPTKRDRRDLDRTQTGWDRWSASLDPPKP